MFGYPLLTIVAPLVLLAIIVWAIVRNRQAGGRARTERATRELYKQENRDAQNDRAV